jgi:hypothetical protein
MAPTGQTSRPASTRKQKRPSAHRQEWSRRCGPQRDLPFSGVSLRAQRHHDRRATSRRPRGGRLAIGSDPQPSTRRDRMPWPTPQATRQLLVEWDEIVAPYSHNCC